MCVCGVCSYDNVSPRSQEEIKADNSSSNSFLLRLSVHILEKKMHLILSVFKFVRLSVCVWTREGKSISFHSRNACMSCTVVCLAERAGEEVE